MKLKARIALNILRFVYWLLLRWEVTGRENVPLTGPVVLVANHVHLADPILLMLAFPRPITFLAKEELFRLPFVGIIMRDAGMFPLARAGSLQKVKDVMCQAETLLNEGRVLALFPEGKRSHTGVLLPARAGAATLSIRTAAPIVPVAIVGTEQLTSRWWWLRRPKLRVIICTPLLPCVTGARLSRTESTRLTTQLMHSIARCLPPQKRGHYAD